MISVAVAQDGEYRAAAEVTDVNMRPPDLTQEVLG